jgi:hypothetical protein
MGDSGQKSGCFMPETADDIGCPAVEEVQKASFGYLLRLQQEVSIMRAQIATISIRHRS